MGYKRRNYISKKEFQAAFILKFLALSISTSFIAIAIFNFVARRKLESVLYSFHVSAKNTGEIILPELLMTTGAVLLLVLIFTTLVVKLIIQGISGPLFRIKKDLMRIEAGDLTTQIVLRTKDEFKDVASDFNQMTEGLRDRYGRISSGLNKLDQATIDLDKYQHQQRAKESLEKARDLVSCVRELRQELNGFRVNPEEKTPS